MATRSNPASSATSPTVTIGGHRIRLTNLDKVLYPQTGTTKADVLEYYSTVADALIPYARNRPATRKRWVHGVGTADAPGESFFQKNLDDATPDWITRRVVRHSDHDNEYPLVNNPATLAWLGQIAALEIHVPQWQFGKPKAGEPTAQRNPDRLVLDLDPGEGTGLLECAEVARLAREILQGMGLDPHPVTSGSKGIQLYAALDGSQTSDQVAAVAHELARALEADNPDLVVSDMKKSLRTGKVLVDWSQNNGNKTTIAPYSLRGRAAPNVAAPRTWRELSSKTLAQLDYRQVMKRLATRGDLLAPLLSGEGGALEPVDEGDEQSDSSRDRLHAYRSMRDAKKTPEPVPADAPAASAGNSFVIQEHHARRLHWDFRLEHDGVLVSWALPKGVPTESGKNHLAVQTEDHPLEYGTFEGSIPAGEYGAGEVTIWDSGSVELEKWREGKEVIATLHGEQRGSHKYALIHTGGAKGNQWLIHLMHLEDESKGAAKETTTAKKPTSKTAKAEKPTPKTTTPQTTPSAAKASASIAPMLATLGDEAAFAARFSEDAADDASEWAFEMKWDGIRIIAEIDARPETGGRGIRLLSRNGIDVTARYPELHDLGDRIPADSAGRTVLDGEIVALTAASRPDFGLLQSRMNLTRKAEIDAARAKVPVQFFVFDLLEGAGHSMLNSSYDERRAALVDTVSPGNFVQVPPAFEGDLRSALDSSRQLGLEGVMAKRRDAPYSAGRRGESWVKLKHHRAQEVIVAGWRPGKGNRQGGIGSLLLGLPDGDDIRYVGRVGTGFGEAQLDEILARLRTRSRKTSPLVDVPAADAGDANWVRPDLVAEVEFAEWTGTGRLRQPVWRGWRPDKNPGDLRVES